MKRICRARTQAYIKKFQNNEEGPLIQNNEQGPLIVFELIISYRSVFFRIYVNLILNGGIKSVLVVISSCVAGQQVHVTSKFMA